MGQGSGTAGHCPGLRLEFPAIGRFQWLVAAQSLRFRECQSIGFGCQDSGRRGRELPGCGVRAAGGLRVYYGADEEARVVNVLAVGFKNRDRVIIGGEEIEL